MLKIVHFTNTFAPLVGGIERSVARFCADLSERGHFCRIVTPAFEGAELSKGGVLRVPAIKGVGQQGFSLRLPTPNLIKHWMEAIEPDILHAHQPFMLGDTAWRIARRRRRPLVFTHHTLYERYADWPILDRNHAQRLLLTLTKQYANRCDLCLAPTDSIAAMMRDRGITVPIEVVPTGIEVERYAHGDRETFRARNGIPADAQVIGHLGRITHAKNIAFLVDAVVELLRGDPGRRFLLVGDGDARAEAERVLSAAGLSSQVVLCGNLHGPEVADAYAAMDLFLFASHTDTQGLVLAEAMAAGVPVVALDAPGARDCIRAGRSGELLPTDATPEAMARVGDELLTNPERLEPLRDGARQRARDFDHERCSNRLDEIYRTLIKDFTGAGEASPESHWDQFVDRLENEWILLAEKYAAAREAVS